MRSVLKCLAIGLSLSIGLAAAQAPSGGAVEPPHWFRYGGKPPPLAPMREVPAVMRTLEPITDPAQPDVIIRNVKSLILATPGDGRCLSVAIVLLPFEGDPGFYHPFLLWLPYAVMTGEVYARWGLSEENDAAVDPYKEGPVRRWSNPFSGRNLTYSSPEALAGNNSSGGSVELIEARFARRETIEAYLKAQPWPKYPYTVPVEACDKKPIWDGGGPSSLAGAYLFARAVIFVPYMHDSQKLTPAQRELWRQHQNDTTMHELTHFEGLLRILSESTAQLQAQAKFDLASYEAEIARINEGARARPDLVRPIPPGQPARKQPLDPYDRQLIRYLTFIHERFNEHAMAYHAFMGADEYARAKSRYDGSGDIPPYMDRERARARLQREFDTHWQQVRAVYPELPETPPQY